MGDLFVTPVPFIDYASGGSAVEWTRTIDNLLNSGWDFDTVIPGHGKVSSRQDLVAWRNRFESMRNRVAEMVKQGRGKDEISRMLVADFGWSSTGMGMRSLDGLLAELK
jgi:cyclase